MFKVSRCIIRWGLISGLALGGVTLLIGPERVAASLAHVRAKAQSVVDSAVDDPLVLRRQLQELADEYPGRIATVRGEIAEVDKQMEQFADDSQVAQLVVGMTTSDLSELKTLIARAETTVEEMDSPHVAIRFEGVRFKIDQAYNEARRINQIRLGYRDRLACNTQQFALLQQQNGRLAEILGQLEDEYATFNTQMWQLDRQIDAIERNSRLIEMTEELQATLNSYDRWGKVGNLKQLEAKLAELTTIQEAQLVALTSRGARNNYEAKARYELEIEDAPSSPFDDPFETIEFDKETETEKSASSMVWMGPVIIE